MIKEYVEARVASGTLRADIDVLDPKIHEEPIIRLVGHDGSMLVLEQLESFVAEVRTVVEKQRNA